MPTPTELQSRSQPDFGLARLIRSIVFLAVPTLAFAGCTGEPGSGHRNVRVGDLKAGAAAKLVSSDGSDILLDSFVAPAPGKAARRRSGAGKVEKIKSPPGTTVLIREIIGDDAHVVIKDGANAGSNCWVECIRLEPVAK